MWRYKDKSNWSFSAVGASRGNELHRNPAEVLPRRPHRAIQGSSQLEHLTVNCLCNACEDYHEVKKTQNLSRIT